MEGWIKEEHEFVNKKIVQQSPRGVYMKKGVLDKGEWPLLVPKGQAVGDCGGMAGGEGSSISSSVWTQQALKAVAR